MVWEVEDGRTVSPASAYICESESERASQRGGGCEGLRMCDVGLAYGVLLGREGGSDSSFLRTSYPIYVFYGELSW